MYIIKYIYVFKQKYNLITVSRKVTKIIEKLNLDWFLF